MTTTYRSLFFFFVLALPISIAAQSTPDPKFEFRSVWLTTAGGLDWPKSTDPIEQQNSLRTIIRQAKAMGLNAITFQVASRGDAYYQSDRLPWSSQLTGVIGRDPGWDPLQFLIDECRVQGMEVHAWYNALNVGGATVTEPGAPLHITQTNSSWVESRNDGNFLNPGYPGARDWVVANVQELVDRYDIDAVNFDFLRYPTNGFTNDFGLHLQYGGAYNNIGEWKRFNVTDITKRVSQYVAQEKPWVKVGSAPIGHYKTSGGWPALYAYSGVYQDSRGWLRDGWNDYIMPQIYWKIYSGPFTNSPEHSWIVKDYAKETYGRHVYVGIGAYVDGTIQQLPAMIDTSRVSGLKGQVYFRWGNVYAFNVMSGTVGPQIQYRRPAIVPVMSWRSQVAPAQPANADGSKSGAVVTLQWERPSHSDNGDTLIRYAIYRTSGSVAPNPEDVISNGANLITMTGDLSIQNTPAASDLNYYYVVTALSRNNVEGMPSNVVVIPSATSIDGKSETVARFELAQNFPNPFNPSTAIRWTMDVGRQTRLTVYDVLGREVSVLVDGYMNAGEHQITFDAGTLSSGVYLYVLTAGDQRLSRTMTLIK